MWWQGMSMSKVLLLAHTFLESLLKKKNKETEWTLWSTKLLWMKLKQSCTKWYNTNLTRPVGWQKFNFFSWIRPSSQLLSIHFIVKTDTCFTLMRIFESTHWMSSIPKIVLLVIFSGNQKQDGNHIGSPSY